MLSATHVPLSRHNFLNLSYQKTVGKMKIMMTRKTVVCDDSSESSDMDSIDSTSDAECYSTDFTSKIGIV